MKLWLVPGSSSFPGSAGAGLPALAPFRLSSAQNSPAQNQLPSQNAAKCAPWRHRAERKGLGAADGKSVQQKVELEGRGADL